MRADMRGYVADSGTNKDLCLKADRLGYSRRLRMENRAAGRVSGGRPTGRFRFGDRVAERLGSREPRPGNPAFVGLDRDDPPPWLLSRPIRRARQVPIEDHHGNPRGVGGVVEPMQRGLD